MIELWIIMPEINGIETRYSDRTLPSLTVEYIANQDHTCTLKWIGSVENKNHHLMWFFSSSAGLLRQLLITGVEKLIIDLSLVERVDSEGLRRLFNTRQEFVQKHIQIILRQPPPHLRRLLRIMQFDQIFEVEN